MKKTAMPSICNLAALLQWHELNAYQRRLAQIEFHKLLDYIKELEAINNEE